MIDIRSFIYDTFTIFDAEHSIHLALVWSIVCLMILVLFYPFIIKYIKLILPCRDKMLPASKIPQSTFRSFMNSLITLWTLVMLASVIPMYRRSGSEYLCFWAFVLQAFLSGINLFTRYRSIRRFTLRYLIWPVHAIMCMANFGYVHYDFINYSWDYHIVHFLPPVFLWTWVLLHIYEYDDDVDVLRIGRLSTFYMLFIGLFFLVVYQNYVTPVEVYENPMEHMFLLATFGLGMVQLFTAIIWTTTRAVYKKCTE
ncbi:hypothetical protein AKO1_008220 [Acrasis kona]|uniref:Transmembrane protein n=1 Tax=Acrasis kona TaxID=1008807 RepID=A0AAW2YM64_9EUKA